MEKFGLQKEWAKWELKQESDVWAVLASFRFLKPISDHLEFYIKFPMGITVIPNLF
mgnify:CR=1 FL=1